MLECHHQVLVAGGCPRRKRGKNSKLSPLLCDTHAPGTRPRWKHLVGQAQATCPSPWPGSERTSTWTVLALRREAALDSPNGREIQKLGSQDGSCPHYTRFFPSSPAETRAGTHKACPASVQLHPFPEGAPSPGSLPGSRPTILGTSMVVL